jgi:hypothetical protein
VEGLYVRLNVYIILLRQLMNEILKKYEEQKQAVLSP